jgi:glycosyltransferase involved in cell wall biosynthesis
VNDNEGKHGKMRIGMMLRSLDEKGGIGVYTRYLAQELLEIDRKNSYVLFYRTSLNLGRFSQYDNAAEYVVPAPMKALWDQVSIPYACWQKKVDVILHPKFTVPVLAPCKKVMVLHGAGWFKPESRDFWRKVDLLYVRYAMPIYCKHASSIISVSQLTTDTFQQVFHLPHGKVQTVYFGPGKQFRRIQDEERLQSVRKKYQLPEKFIFTLSGYDRGDRKNITGILNAYKTHYGRTPHKLVIGGKDCHRFKEDYRIPETGYGQGIIFTDWIEQEDLPSIYSTADVFLYPSKHEAFPIPITEAMACGTPIITSDANGLREIAGDAALFVDPNDHEEIARALLQALMDDELRTCLSIKALERAQFFSWEKCARTVLQLLEDLS